MTKRMRYAFYGLIFLFALLGLVSHVTGVLIGSVALGIIIGVVTDWIDNRRDLPFRKYNVKHGHYHSTHIERKS